MEDPMNHADRRQRYENYRDTARRLYENVGIVQSEHIMIPRDAQLKVVSGGAFVDAIIWIPEEKLVNENS